MAETGFFRITRQQYLSFTIEAIPSFALSNVQPKQTAYSNIAYKLQKYHSYITHILLSQETCEDN